MGGYLQDLMSKYCVKKTVNTPANNNLFEETDPSELLTAQKKQLHTLVAKLLYLTTRVRPDILFVVNYLTTRVNKFNKGEWKKAYRILEYLNGSLDIGMNLDIENHETINMYADASYGIHEDCKSHSAGVVKLGNATVYVKSKKQGNVTKSSTEAELVCVTDMIPMAYYVRNFLDDNKDDPIVLYQDNTPTIAMMTNTETGGRRLRSQHISIKHFFIKERIQNGEIVVKHMPTEILVTDILTKPLQGKGFLSLRDLFIK